MREAAREREAIPRTGRVDVMMMTRTDRVDVINDERQRSCSGARSNPAHRESFKLDLTDEEWASDWVRERKESGSGGLSSRRGSGEAASPDSLNLEQRLAFDLLQSWFDSWSRIQFDGSNEPACEPALALVYGVGGTGKSAALRCFQSYVAAEMDRDYIDSRAHAESM